jgi:hypothetical protein
MTWVCPRCGAGDNDEMTTRCICGHEQVIQPIKHKPDIHQEYNAYDQRVVLWTFLAFATYPISAGVGALFTIGQDGPGAAMGFGLGLMIGTIILTLPSSFRLAYLLRSTSHKITKKKKVIGRIAVACNVILLLPLFAVLIAEGYFGCAILSVTVTYLGIFGFSRPHIY